MEILNHVDDKDYQDEINDLSVENYKKSKTFKRRKKLYLFFLF